MTMVTAAAAVPWVGSEERFPGVSDARFQDRRDSPSTSGREQAEGRGSSFRIDASGRKLAGAPYSVTFGGDANSCFGEFTGYRDRSGGRFHIRWTAV